MIHEINAFGCCLPADNVVACPAVDELQSLTLCTAASYSARAHVNMNAELWRSFVLAIDGFKSVYALHYCSYE